jgi:hypothetical protein
MNPTENENTNAAFECPPLPPERRAQCDGLIRKRVALLNLNEVDSSEEAAEQAGELLLEAENIARTWRECCEQSWREKNNAMASGIASPIATASPRAHTGTSATSAEKSQPVAQEKTSLVAEYFALKEREKKGEVPANTAFDFYRQNASKIRCERSQQKNENDEN